MVVGGLKFVAGCGWEKVSPSMRRKEDLLGAGKGYSNGNKPKAHEPNPVKLRKCWHEKGKQSRCGEVEGTSAKRWKVRARANATCCRQVSAQEVQPGRRCACPPKPVPNQSCPKCLFSTAEIMTIHQPNNKPKCPRCPANV